ncbi:MAG: hypothetical protein COW79_13105 [Bdellovibrionales bacterium CG22_combo_CG10-13_8_21_14_all_38_13]|nr:MAG: hypothetical protein COW79_13105 [Bdellovibrionales bacterium CG22_combo_CG10-13_8_21_14_all_38_13]
MRLILLFLILLSPKIFANSMHACAGDVQKFCQGVEKTRFALDQCLNKHAESLGPSCKAVRAEFAKKVKENNKCYGDIQKYCSDKTNPKDINECLKTNEKNLSKECLAQKDKRIKEMKPCLEDQEKFCSKEKLGKNSLAKCMLENSSKFSKACSEARSKFEAKVMKKQPCFKDAILLCDDVKKDGKKLEVCLGSNQDKLTKECKDHRQKIDDKISARNPCYLDAKKLCDKERFRPELLNSCLEKNESKLSKLCQETRTLAARQQKNIKDSCAADEKKYCSSIPKKGAAVVTCLKSNLGRISFQCKKALTD